ncbi:MAG: methyltransferase domain-containing protein [Planctomycetes bacterium]|nr:methyltransferase domain-containing protein [Planctomycetota bacterium]
MTQEPLAERPSLEALAEAGMLKLESLHPGGLALTRELAERCNIRDGTGVLDIASGTGETACFLAEVFAARVVGVDRSETMIRRAKAKARAKGLAAAFTKGDATHLPFGDAGFDAAICECTLCLFEKERALGEMARVVRPGGCVGIHDLCWKEEAPDCLRSTLAEIEDERPETPDGWRKLFHHAGLTDVHAFDKAGVMLRWMADSRKQLGATGRLGLAARILARWGVRGLWSVWRSERVFASGLLGYGIIVG